ncbi:MAG: sigma-70 family RNA polymerase sigma factor [Schwartzia sp.]|nr:sigma-70 family RNA polymerase sigma factor [Schwartzia sp. (in: firmicutes)]
MRFEDYIRELDDVETLAPEREAALWRAFKEERDEAARREIIQSYQPLVFKNALPYRTLDSVMDLVQEGTVGLIEAVESYDHRRGVAFSLFAVHRIRGRMMDFLKKEGSSALACIDGAMDEDGLSVKDRLVDTAASVSEQAEVHELSARVREALSRLPQKERLVLEQVFLGRAEVREVAEQMNLSPSHIYRLQKTGIRRIRGMMSRFMHYW